MTLNLRHIDRFKDRYGHERIYFRAPGGPRVPLPSMNDPSFISAYQAVLAAMTTAPETKLAGHPGSIRRLVSEYYASLRYLRNRPSSREVTRRILDRFAEEHGHRMVRDLQRKHLEKIIGAKANTPAAANNLLKKVRALLNYAVATGDYRNDNPANGIERFREGTHHTWTEAEIAKFEKLWPLGTRERTAFALALYTARGGETSLA